MFRGTRLRVSEWIVLGYFLYLAVAAYAQGANSRRRYVGLIPSGLALGLLVRAAALPFSSWVRDWLPAGDLVLAYWLPALIAPSPDLRWERRFTALDDCWLGPDLLRRSERWSLAVTGLLEFSYLFCYPMVPLGFAGLFFGGFRSDADGFWTAILVAALPCYGLVLWLPMRPPRILERALTMSQSTMRVLNLRVLRHASIQLNTFPSAHVAASVATALTVTARRPLIGAALGAMTVGITVGSVVRRYHFAVDAVTGLALGVIGYLVARSI